MQSVNRQLAKSAFLGCILACVSGPVCAQIQYTAEVVPSESKLKITMHFVAKTNLTELKLPNWSPGAYVLRDSYQSISDLKVTSDSKQLEPEQLTNTWKLKTAPGQKIQAQYSLPMTVTDDTVHWSGPTSYLYVANRKLENCRLKIIAPENWGIAVGLNEVSGDPTTFVAEDYDVLADNPMTVGKFLQDTYVFRGKPHIISLRNAAKSKVDRESLIKACKAITQMQSDFFGDLPYDKYVWHFAVNDAPDGAGGLEHLSSTQITLASGVGPRAQSVLSHEFFHLWNVKRIRSKVLGPFDYDVLPKTGALWWLEGVTDYYAHLLLVRYGWWPESMLYRDIESNLAAIQSNPARLEVSPHESSYRVGEANNGRGNSNGYRISYYTLGWLCGLALDLEIRSQTDGKASLDDVMRALYAITKNNKPGFEEDEIRKQCVRFGGPTLGGFYDQIILKPGELPLEKLMQKFGLESKTVEETVTDIGFRLAPVPNQGARFTGDLPKITPPIQENDIVVKMNGISLEGSGFQAINRSIQQASSSLKPGDSILLEIKRDGKTMEVKLEAKSRMQRSQRVGLAAMQTDDTKRLRTGWIYAGKKPVVKEPVIR